MLKVAIKRDEEVKGGVGGDNGHMKGGRDKEDLEMNCFKRGNPVVEEDHYEENNTLEVLSSIVDPMSQLSEKVSKIQLSEMPESEIKTSDESTSFKGDEAEFVQGDDVEQTIGKIDSPEPDLQLAIDLVASRVGEEGSVIKDLSKILLKTNLQDFSRRLWNSKRVEKVRRASPIFFPLWNTSSGEGLRLRLLHN